MDVKVKKLHKNAIIPTYATDGDACLDLTCVSVEERDNFIQYNTGLAMEIPYGYVGMIFPRSSVTKKDLMLKNSVGVIDCVPFGTKIQMADGTEKMIEDILNSKGKLDEIKSYNETTSEFEDDVIEEIWKVEGKNIVEIEDEDGDVIRVPETKEIYTNNGWKQIKDLDLDIDKVLKW